MCPNKSVFSHFSGDDRQKRIKKEKRTQTSAKYKNFLEMFVV